MKAGHIEILRPRDDTPLYIFDLENLVDLVVEESEGFRTHIYIFEMGRSYVYVLMQYGSRVRGAESARAFARDWVKKEYGEVEAEKFDKRNPR